MPKAHTPAADAADDAFALDFPPAPPPPLGRGAPAWSRHLHECQHDTKREVQRLRYESAGRDRKLDQILILLGEEGDDGESGRGFIGIALRNRRRIEQLEAERNLVRGALLAIGALGAAMAAMFTAWVRSLR